MYKQLVQQTVKQKVKQKGHKNYFVLLIKQFVVPKLVESLYWQLEYLIEDVSSIFCVFNKTKIQSRRDFSKDFISQPLQAVPWHLGTL